MRRLRPAAAAAALAFAFAFAPLPGCILAAAAAAGAAAVGVVSYQNNEAVMDHQAPFADVWNAAIRALRNLGYAVPDTPPPTRTEGSIETADAKVTIERHPGDVTRIRARVGTFDTDENERRAKLVLEEIKRILPPAPN